MPFSKTLGVVSFILFAATAQPGSANDMFTQGFHFDNAARQACNVGPDYDPQMTSMMAQIGFGFDEVDAPEGIEHRLFHPAGITIDMYPGAVDAPTCVMLVDPGTLSDEMWPDFINATVQSLPDYEMGEPEIRDGETVWRYTSNPDTYLGITWSTLLTRLDDGTTIIERTPISIE